MFWLIWHIWQYYREMKCLPPMQLLWYEFNIPKKLNFLSFEFFLNIKFMSIVFQTFGNKLLTYGAWVIPLMVAISAFGGLCVHIMASSRMCFVGARNGHMPALLSHINVKTFTPVPSLVFLVRID